MPPRALQAAPTCEKCTLASAGGAARRARERAPSGRLFVSFQRARGSVCVFHVFARSSLHLLFSTTPSLTTFPRRVWQQQQRRNASASAARGESLGPARTAPPLYPPTPTKNKNARGNSGQRSFFPGVSLAAGARASSSPAARHPVSRGARAAAVLCARAQKMGGGPVGAKPPFAAFDV